jgi:hypothetical protein
MSLRIGGVLVIAGLVLALALGSLFVVVGLLLVVCGGIVVACGMESLLVEQTVDRRTPAEPVGAERRNIAA